MLELVHDDAAATGPELVAAALELAELGFSMVPEVPGARKPPFKTGPGHADGASNDPEVLRDWFSEGRWDIALVLHLSGHVALDVDLKLKTVDVAGAFVKLEERAGFGLVHRLSDVTATELTPNGGFHYLFSLPDGVDKRELRGRLSPGLELQSHLLVVAPSRGRRWLPRPSGEIAHPRTGVLELPQPILEQARKPAKVVIASEISDAQVVDGIKGISGLHRWLRRQPAGNRNNGLYWAACTAARLVLTGDASVQHVQLLAQTGIKIGLPEHEALRTVESALQTVLGEGAVGEPAPGRRSGGFTQIPVRVVDCVTDGSLTIDEYALLCYIWQRRDWMSGVFVATGPELLAAFKCHRQTLWRRFRTLESAGWIRYVGTPGPGHPLQVKLGPEATRD